MRERDVTFPWKFDILPTFIELLATWLHLLRRRSRQRQRRNPLMSTGHWWVGCYIWYSEEGTGGGRSPPRPLLAIPKQFNSPPINGQCIPIAILLYNGPLLCGFNVPVKGLMHRCCRSVRSSVAKMHTKKEFTQKLNYLGLWSLFTT